MKNRSLNIKRLFIGMACVLALVFPALMAQAHAPLRHKKPHKPPKYKYLDGTVVVKGVVRRGVLSARVKGQAGRRLEINGELPLRANRQLGVWLVNINLKKRVVGKIKISRIPAPAQAPPNSVGFFNVEMEDFTDAAIAGARITFWTGHRFRNVRLGHLHNGVWTILKTTVVESGARRTKYSAVSPGFSSFAIIADQATGNAGHDKAANDSPPPASYASLYVLGILGVALVLTGSTIRFKAKS